MSEGAPGVPVGALLGVRGATSGLDLDLLAGAAGLDRYITSSYVQPAGLAVAGVDEDLPGGCALVFGDSEARSLSRLDAAGRAAALRQLFRRDLPCVILTGGLEGPPELTTEAERAGVPLLRTALSTPVAIARLTARLEDRLAPRETRHGVLVDLLGLGVLLTGESGIGKSECALDLIGRGHRLIADDAVEIRCRGEAVLIGTCPEISRHHVEVRGLGLVNVTDLFGVSATRSSKRVELIVHLERWDAGREYDRLGLEGESEAILGVQVPRVTIPVGPGRNVAMLVEVAARNQLLRMGGRHAAQALAERLERRLERLGERDPDRPPDADLEDLETEDQ